MFIMRMPSSFQIGDRATVRINRQRATLWWRDAQTLVIDDTDARRICVRRVDDAEQVFTCTDADGTAYTLLEETMAGCVVGPE